jgi:hypothetical protein
MSRVTTREIFDNNASLSQRLNTPQAKLEIAQQQEKRKREEMAIIKQSSGSICPVRKLDNLQEKIVNLKPEEFKNIIRDQFYNPEVMTAAMCVTNAIVYTNPAVGGNLSDNERIRLWLRDLRRIGAESVEGYAMTAGVQDANQVFIVKAPRSIQNDELQHELFVGLFGLNPLRRSVPNFAYILGGFQCSPPLIDSQSKEVVAFCNNDRVNVNYVLYENVTPAITMREYISRCTPQEFVNKYLQILYALHEAWRACQFTHYDLHDENVLIRNVGDTGFYIKYRTERGTEYLQSDAVATIIDYGLAHIKYEGKHYGIYNRIPWGVYPRRAFPMHDAYKLLLMSMRSMLQANNLATFNEAAKILRFFNKDESAIDIVRAQSKTYYYLPMIETTEKVTHWDLAAYIRSVCNVNFIQSNPGNDKVLQCSGSHVCLSRSQVFNRIGVNDKLHPSNLFEFYDIATKMIDQGRKVEYKELLARFNYRQALIDGVREYNNMVIDLNRLISQLKVMPLNGASLSTILTYPMMAQYRQYLTHVADVFDTLQQIDLHSAIIRSVAQAYEDSETIAFFNNNQLELLPSRQLLKESIDSISRDRIYVRNLFDNPNNRPQIEKALTKDYRLEWYYTGFKDFDYVVM